MAKRKVTKEESEIILLSLQGLTEIGQSITEAFETLNAAEDNKKLKKIFTLIINKIKKENSIPANVMYSFGILSKIEETILESSTSARNAIESIIELRNMTNKFEKNIIGIFAMPILIILGTLKGMVFVQPKMIGMATFVENLVKAQKGIKPEIEIEWWMTNENIIYVDIAFYVVLFGTIFSIFLYKYYKKNNLKLIYKKFKTKAYDDIPIIFTIMSNLKGSGLSGVKIMELMKEQEKNKTLKKMYSEIEIEMKNGKDGGIYHIFEKYNFPKDILNLLKSAEISNNLWERLPKIIKYAENINKTRNDILNKVLSKPILFLSYAFLGYPLISVVLTGIGVMGIMTSLM